MPTFPVDFEVFCACGHPMCADSNTRESRHRAMPQVVVAPCPKCLQKAKDEGDSEGYDRGYEDGKQEASRE